MVHEAAPAGPAPGQGFALYLLHFTSPDIMSLIAIGDIHGCAATLDRLLERLRPTAEDHLVFVGDYIDRGPDSKRVIDRLLELRNVVNCTFLRGNHEAFMLGYLDHGALRDWRGNGGLDTLRSYLNGHDKAHVPEAHVAFVRATEPYYETSDFFFVHAGLKPHLSIEENKRRFGEDVFLWERSHMEAQNMVWEKPVICGHTPLRDPLDRDRLIAIDTGCVYHNRPGMGRLTAVRLPEREFVFVDYVG